jgi:hypothetical protein
MSSPSGVVKRIDNATLLRGRRVESIAGRIPRGVERHFESIDDRFVQLEAELRRHAGVLIEQIIHGLHTVAETVVANTEAISQRRLRLDVR